MDNTDIPTKFPIPWGNSAGGAFIRNIPEASQIGVTPGAASLTDGFPPLNFDPVAAGGIPPFGQDFNGIFKQVTAWLQWAQAGGAVPHDATFSTAIGGYPMGAMLIADTYQRLWVSTSNNNATDPDSAGAGWITMAHAWATLAYQGGGSANAQTLSLSPTPASLAQLTRVPILFQANASNTGAATLTVNGLAATAMKTPLGTDLPAGYLIAGAFYQVIYTGSVFMVTGTSPSGFTSQQSFTSTATWTAPAGIFRAKVRVWGGGGGGGGGNSTGAGGGASGGGYAEGVTPVTPGGIYTVTVGTGGSGGSANTAGSNGSASSFSGVVSGTGGLGGNGSGAGLSPGQAVVGAGSGGSIAISGGVGYGANGPLDGAVLSGVGGAAFSTSISPSTISGTGAAGNPGNFPGGGGSGGAYAFGGGVGAAGLVIVEW